MGKTRGRNREEEHGALWLALTLDVVRGGVLAAAVALILLAVAAWLISVGMLSDAMGDRAVIAACLVGASVGGLLTVTRRSAMPLVSGLGAGIVLFLMLLTAGVLVYEAVPASREVGVNLCACLCGGGLAAILGSKPKKKRRR